MQGVAVERIVATRIKTMVARQAIEGVTVCAESVFSTICPVVGVPPCAHVSVLPGDEDDAAGSWSAS